MYRVFLLLIIVFISSCQSTDNSGEPTTTSSTQSESTRLMALQLDSLKRGVNPMNSTFENLKRAELFLSKSNTGNIGTDLMAKLRGGFEYMNAGLNQKSLKLFNEVYDYVKNNAQQIGNSTEILRLVLNMRAVNHFRIGELSNCLENHNEASCIMPFNEQSFHKNKQGSEAAISDLMELLTASPDIQNAYLLNIAHMTLGQYPDGVPAKYRINLFPKEKQGLVNPFTNIGSAVGIDDNQLSGGSIVDDFTGNGYYDIIASSWSLGDQLMFYRNNGDGTFTESHEAAGLKGITGGLNITHTDYNNDGHLDVLILRGAWIMEGYFPNSLLRNNGDGTFTDVTVESGIYSRYPTLSAAWADFNNDGFLDLFVANEDFRKSNKRHPCELFINNGDETFTEVASVVGVRQNGMFKGVTIADYDNDNDQDIYLSNLTGNNVLLRNDSNANNPYKFSFTDVTTQSGTEGSGQNFATWFFDFNNDGNLDLFASSYATRFYNNISKQCVKELLGQPVESDIPCLYINNGDGTFTNIAAEANLNKAFFIMGAGYGDMNNDGYLDLYFGTGEPDLKAVIPNRAFVNMNGQTCQEVTSQSRLGHLQKGHGISFADIDFDGDQDIYSVMGGAYQGDVFFNALFENKGHQNNWLRIKLMGEKTNRAAIGARLELQVRSGDNTRKICRHVSNGSSFGENPFTVEFGFLSNEEIVDLTIIWPDGSSQIIDTIDAKKYYSITEASNDATLLNLPKLKIQQNHNHEHHHHN